MWQQNINRRRFMQGGASTAAASGITLGESGKPLDKGAAATRSQPGGSAMPQMRDLNGRKVLFVDDKPYLILGLQWDCDTPVAPEISDPLYPQAAKMGCNTAVLPLHWQEIEPEDGKYDLRPLDHRIEQARRSGLRIALVWFGAYKNACLHYAPEWVKADVKRFRRVHKADGTPLLNFSCPTSAETLNRDRRAVEAVFRRLRTTDSNQRTVILFQTENEPGLLGTDRCYCSTCNRLFASGGWADRESDRAAEAFTAHHIATYLDNLSAAAKAIYPLPIYLNVWLGSKTGVPGKSYPSGGAVERVLDIYSGIVKHVDFISPDIYGHALQSFRGVCKAYSGRGWPLYIAEHSSGKGARAERNVYYALGEFAAIGFSPWAIDHPYPDIDGQPLVHQLDQRWSDQAYDLRDSYVAIRDAMAPIARAQNTDNLKFFVQEAEEKELRVTFGKVTVQALCRHPAGMARGMAVRLSENEFLVLGSGIHARFLDANGQGIPLARVDRGRYEGDNWRTLLPVRREREDRSIPFRIAEPQVIRVSLDVSR